MNYACPACGYPSLQEPPRSSESGGSYEICPSCGFEFGVTDDDEKFSYESWREIWIANGMRWWAQDFEEPPVDWDPAAQLRRLLDGSADRG